MSLSTYQRKISLAQRPLNSLLSRKQSARIRQSRTIIQTYQLQKLEFSTKTLQFIYKGGHSQYAFNKELKLTNKTGVRIGFKIKSNNPQNYQVTPNQERIQINGQIEIKMRLYIQVNNLQKYSMDRFLIEWGYIDDTNSTIYTDKAYLNVEVVLGVNTIKNQEICRGVVQADKNIKVYIGLIGVNKTKIKELQQEIREYQEMPKPMTISMPVAVFLAVIAFVLGYMIF